MSGKGTQYILRKVSVIEKFASLVWFPIKYTVSFNFKKSLFKTLSKLLSQKMKDCKVCYQNCKKYSGMCNQHVFRKNTSLEDISVILFLKKPEYKSLRILVELVLAVPN